MFYFFALVAAWIAYCANQIAMDLIAFCWVILSCMILKCYIPKREMLLLSRPSIGAFSLEVFCETLKPTKSKGAYYFCILILSIVLIFLNKVLPGTFVQIAGNQASEYDFLFFGSYKVHIISFFCLQLVGIIVYIILGEITCKKIKTFSPNCEICLYIILVSVLNKCLDILSSILKPVLIFTLLVLVKNSNKNSDLCQLGWYLIFAVALNCIMTTQCLICKALEEKIKDYNDTTKKTDPKYVNCCSKSYLFRIFR